jgi:hypothetical protein
MPQAQSARVELSGVEILATIRRLERRIEERFPGAGLGGVCSRLAELAATADAEIARLRKPLWALRIATVVGAAGLLAIAVEMLILGLPPSLQLGSLAEFLQASEAAINLAVLLAIGVYSTVTLEARFKRRAALKALYRLRSIVHIVDMHQLAKDPEFALSPAGRATASSPQRAWTRFELVRYLSYCSELFALSSKVAALYAEHLNDAVVLESVNDIESLSASLSHKVWQKIMILDTARAEDALRPPPDG